MSVHESRATFTTLCFRAFTDCCSGSKRFPSLLPERPIEAKEKLDNAIDQAADVITEARDAVQGLRDSTVQSNDLALAISTLGEELGTDSSQSSTCIPCRG